MRIVSRKRTVGTAERLVLSKVERNALESAADVANLAMAEIIKRYGRAEAETMEQYVELGGIASRIDELLGEHEMTGGDGLTLRFERATPEQIAHGFVADIARSQP